MFSWMNPKLEVRQTERIGKGVFAKEAIKQGEMLFVMGGYILTIEDENNLKGIVADKPAVPAAHSSPVLTGGGV